MFFLYVYEPGGNRIELCNPAAPPGAGAGLADDYPDRSRTGQGHAWGLKAIESFHTDGTRQVGGGSSVRCS